MDVPTPRARLVPRFALACIAFAASFLAVGCGGGGGGTGGGTPFAILTTSLPTAGVGSVVVKAGAHQVGVLNLQGRTFMAPIDCPFARADEELLRLRAETSIIVVDMHAEATSEKQAMGWYLDGRVSAVVGTHSHVQTADERLLPQGTAYLTDLGLTGPIDSVIGVEPELAIQRFRTGMPNRFEPARGRARFQGAVIRVDPESGADASGATAAGGAGAGSTAFTSGA